MNKTIGLLIFKVIILAIGWIYLADRIERIYEQGSLTAAENRYKLASLEERISSIEILLKDRGRFMREVSQSIAERTQDRWTGTKQMQFCENLKKLNEELNVPEITIGDGSELIRPPR